MDVALPHAAMRREPRADAQVAHRLRRTCIQRVLRRCRSVLRASPGRTLESEWEVAANALRPTRVSARGWAGEGSGARTPGSVEGNANVRAPLLQDGSPGTADGEAISVPDRSFPGSPTLPAPPSCSPRLAPSESASRQRPFVEPRWTQVSPTPQPRGLGRSELPTAERQNARSSFSLRMCAAHVALTHRSGRASRSGDGPPRQVSCPRRQRCDRSRPRASGGRRSGSTRSRASCGVGAGARVSPPCCGAPSRRPRGSIFSGRSGAARPC